ncbi:MAG: hypothetical protein Kow0068_12270 [Marinilabiliales bacterium]
MFSQENDIVLYFDENWGQVFSKDDAHYYRYIDFEDDTTITVKDYYINGIMYMLGHYKSIKPEIKHGKFTFWHPNGVIMAQGEYSDNKKIGKWIEYDENGNIRSEQTFNKVPDVFKIVDEMPQFPGGNDSLYKYLSEKIIYPESAKKNKIQGTVYVSFIIDETGVIKNIEIEKGIDKECDNIAFRAIQNMPKWEPGKLKGKPVKVQYVIPVTFKL